MFTLSIERVVITSMLLATLVAGCSSPFVPDDPLIRHYPTAIERGWWSEVAACMGIPEPPIERVTFWIVRAGHSFDSPDGHRRGWWEPAHTIYLTSAWWADESLVKHEMVHDMLQTGGHASPAFDRCTH